MTYVANRKVGCNELNQNVSDERIKIMRNHHSNALYLFLTLTLYFFHPNECFTLSRYNAGAKTIPTHAKLSAKTNEYKEKEEEARLNILKARRKQIRSTLKSAEGVRNYRLANGKLIHPNKNVILTP